ncbi:sigma-54 interaction domain-containing protein [Cytobacillus sp. Hm23]
MEQVNTEEMVKAILESIDEAIHVVDNNGVTIFYNNIAAKHDGVSIEEVLGKHLLHAFPSLTEKTSTLLKVIASKKPIFHLPQTYKNIRGELIDTVNTTIPIIVNDNIVGAVEIAKDYSKMKLLSQKLMDLQSKLNINTKKPRKINGAKYTFEDILTVNKAVEHVKEQAKKIAKNDSTVLVYGETGSGKELLVHAIHNESTRKSGAFIVQNCAALPENLLEGLLFGTVKGSYTGAVDRPGLFEIAHGGTLFLDEINSMPLELQAKLLRVLEDGLVRRVGSEFAYQVDVRVIVALNETPANCLKNNQLRPDLYYRLNVLSLEIPPLKARKDDITFLLKYFIASYNQSSAMEAIHINEEVYEYISNYSWPGNIRELKHTVEYAMTLLDGRELTLEHFPHNIISSVKKNNEVLIERHHTIKPLREVLSQTEKTMIESAIQTAQGNIQQAAKMLQIPRQTLQYKMKKFNL